MSEQQPMSFLAFGDVRGFFVKGVEGAKGL